MVPRTVRGEASGRTHVRRLRAGLVTGLGLWAFVLLRVVLIQTVHSPELARCAERQHVVRVRLAPDRGTIYDRNMVPLTANLTVPSVCVDPEKTGAPARVARRLADALGGSAREYAAKMRKGDRFAWIERQVQPDRAERVRSMDLPGVSFLTESKRVYPYGRTACHVIGLTDLDGRGLSGIELQMDDVLAGSEACVYYSRDGVGRRSPTPACTRTVPKDGSSVVLTIDLELQSVAEVELERAIREHGAASGSVIVQDPWTGDILAMANWPAFDPNRPEAYSAAARRNRAITDQFEPGSTFKVVTATAALETRAADLKSIYYAYRGSRRYGSFTIHDVKEYGWLDLEHAFAKSSNVCFAEIAGRVGDVPLYSCAREYGFGCLTGIALPGEVRGTLREPEEWSRRSVHTIGIGQEVAVTALQLVGAYSALANGGHLMEPRIIKAVATDGGVEETAPPWPLRRVASPEIARTMRRLLVEAAQHGTGRKACVTELPVAGKTGTAQKVVAGVRGYAPGKFIGSFAGFVPADDPHMVILVVIDEPEGRGLGGDVAAPVFSGIVERVARGPLCAYVYGDPSMRFVGWDGPEYAGLDAAAACETAEGGVDAVAAACVAGTRFDRMFAASGEIDAGAPIRVPDLAGMSIRAARRAGAERGLEVVFEGSGIVRAQSPPPGHAASAGDRVMVRCRAR